MILEVGTVLYTDDRISGMNRYVVTRVTPKMAFVQINDRGFEIKFDRGFEIKFDRDVRSGKHIRAKGDHNKWNYTFYHVETDELKERYALYVLRKKFRRIDADELTAEKLVRILDIVKGD